MPAHIELVNVTELSPVKMTQVEQIAWLQLSGIKEFYSVGSGKGGRVMVRPEDVETVRAVARPVKGGSRRGRLHIKARPYPIVQPLPPVDLEALETWKTQIEDVVMEQEGRVDQLHKAVEKMTETYVSLRVLVDKSVNLPEPPPLPPKYRYKVVVVGGDERTPRRLAEIFPPIRFHHIHMDRGNQATSAWPDGDLIIFMKNFSSHSLFDRARVRYGSERVNIVGGAISSAESVISLWLVQQQQRENERLAQQGGNP